MQAETAQARVWMDVTTSLRNAGHHANGTLRVERELAAALRAELGDRLAFCHYRSTERRFAAVDFNPSFRTDAPAPRGKPSSFGATRQESLGRRAERGLRLALRRFARATRERLSPPDAAALFPDARAGDVLLLGGESWSERYDFEVMTRLRSERGLRIAAMCQDVIPLNHPQFFASDAFIARHRAYIDWLLSNVDLVMTISRSVQSDLIAQSAARGIAGPAVGILPLGAYIEKAEPRKPITEPPLQADRFVISVSTIQSRKNFDLLYRLWQRFADEGRHDLPRLVIVGARGFGSGDLLDQIARDPRVRDSILVLHDASDAELAWLYRNCCFTLYPSFAEGWGLPIAESLAYGKPCLASNTTSMPEAGAGLAVHLDPLDFRAWHDTIIAWSDDVASREAMARDIVATYRPVTWADSAAALAGQLRSLTG
jgi:glycosyltransferase involved in cell wall biosynthesis